MTIYCRATDAQEAVLREVVSEHHERLVVGGVRIDLLEARIDLDDDGEPTGPALTHGGYPALVIDGHWWEEGPLQERKALVDHEPVRQMYQLDQLDLFAVRKRGERRPDAQRRPL